MCRAVRLLLFIFSLSCIGAVFASGQISSSKSHDITPTSKTPSHSNSSAKSQNMQSINQILINVNGLQGDLLQNVTNALKNQKNEILTPITADGVRDFYKTAPKTIREALQPYGYFKPTIQSNLSRVGNQWTVTFNIQQGPPVYITQVDLDIIGPGKNNRAFQKVYTHLPSKVGEILNTEKYDKTKQLLYDIASVRGYFDAKMLENKIYINLKTLTARILIKFKTGPRYYFGDTLFSESPFNPKFLTRFLRYKKGQHYNYHKLERTQEDFIDSNYFTQALVTPLTDQAENLQVPIQIKLTPRKRYSYTMGFGYGTDTGVRGTLGFEVRRVNHFGHQFKTVIQGAKNNSYASATYYIPGRHPASDIWAVNTGYADFSQVTGTGRSFKLEASYTTTIGRWKQTAALTFLNERYNIVTFPFTQAKVLYPNINWQYIQKHRQLYPKRGINFSAFLGGTPSEGSSNNGFIQARVNAKGLLTLFHTTRFLLRTSMARTQIQNLQGLPFSLQLFAGGPRSIRGYSYNQIGPGKNLFVGSFEIQQRIFGNWYLAGFFDAGNVTDRDPFEHLNIGVGPGIAWLSPVGIIELTVARAITQKTKPWVIQFTMGPDL